MTGESAAGEVPFTIRGSGGIFRNKSVAVSRECIQIIKNSGKIEVSCPLSKAKLACCEYWELRAGVFGPVTTRKLILQLWDATGNLLTLPNATAHFYVENFTVADVKKLAEAIAKLRPDILVVDKTLSVWEAGKLLSAPSGNWKCPLCQALNPISEPLWKLQQSMTARGQRNPLCFQSRYNSSSFPETCGS